MRVVIKADGWDRVYCIADIARQLGCSVQAIWSRVYLTATLPAPTVSVGKKKYYSEKTYQCLVSALMAERAQA